MGRRLLYVIGELHTGGSERQLCYLLRAMDRERYKPAVAVWNYSERDIHVPLIRGLDVPIFPLPQVRARGKAARVADSGQAAPTRGCTLLELLYKLRRLLDRLGNKRSLGWFGQERFFTGRQGVRDGFGKAKCALALKPDL